MPSAPSNNRKLNKQFIEAARNNKLDELKNLLGQGANIHADDDWTLKWAAINGQLETVKLLFTQGANICADDDDALRSSALYGHLEIVKFLVTHGANIHVNDDEIFKTAIKDKNEPVLILLNAFLTEEKLLMAALGSTSASSCLCGMPVLPAVGSMPQTQRVKLKKSYRSKI